DGKTGCLDDLGIGAALDERFAGLRRASALPEDRRADGAAGFAVPYHQCFTLVGNRKAAYRGGVCVGDLRNDRADACPDVVRRLLGPAGAGIGRFQRGGCLGNHLAGAVDQDGLGLGGPLVCGDAICAAHGRFRAIALPAACAIPGPVRPNCSNSQSTEPVGTKPGKPSRSPGTGVFPAVNSETAPPRPPRMTASSTVTMAPVSMAAAATALSSSGLMVAMLSTRAEIPSPCRVSAARTAR